MAAPSFAETRAESARRIWGAVMSSRMTDVFETQSLLTACGKPELRSELRPVGFAILATLADQGKIRAEESEDRELYSVLQPMLADSFTRGALEGVRGNPEAAAALCKRAVDRAQHLLQRHRESAP